MIKLTETEWENLEHIDATELILEIMPSGELAMKKALLVFESTLKKQLTGTRSGRAYKVSKTGALHIASAPGESPAVLFDALRGSVGHDGPERVGFTVIGQVGTGLGQPPRGPKDAANAYARRLEFGGASKTAKGSGVVKIEARPYMAPAQDIAEPLMDAIFERRVGGR